VATIQEAMGAFAEFSRDPLFRPDLKHLVDLAEITEYIRSYPDLMKFLAIQAGTLMKASGPTYMVFLAPTPVSRSMAHSALKSWDGLGAIIGRVVQHEAEALEMLGLEQRSIAELPFSQA
jgi:hypothetical protein